MLDETAKKLAQAPNLAAVATLLRSGQPMNHLMWVDADDDYVYVNTEVHRQVFKNVQRDPRITVLIMDRDSPFDFAEVRGRVIETVTGEEARRHIDELSQKYTGGPYANPIQTERVKLKIEPRRVVTP
jgi:PPOX class probable F420-dependent enzyme